MRIRLVFLAGLLACCGVASDAAMGAPAAPVTEIEAPAVRLALNDIFGDSLIAENVAAVRKRVSTLPLEQQYELLRSHVLPSNTHDTIRLVGLQTATSPVPSQISREPQDVERLRLAAELGQRRISTGGILVSPAFDLLAVGSRLGRLEELKQSVLRFRPTSEHQQRCRLVFLALLGMKQQNTTAAGDAVDEFCSRWKRSKEPELTKRWPETLLAWSAVDHKELRGEAKTMLFEMIVQQIRKGVSNGPAQWDRLISHTFGKVYTGPNSTGPNSGGSLPAVPLHPYGTNPPLRQWHAVSQSTGWSHGIGIPAAVWQLRGDMVSNLASHDTEFLFYEVPLLGDFTLECECTCFGYKDTHPLVSGTWLAPTWNHSEFSIGGLTTVRPNGQLAPKLSPVDEWLRYRIDIRDNVCRRYINGRLIHTEDLSANRDPWVAIRSPEYGRGNVKDIRITGQPQIPRSVSLVQRTSSHEDTDTAVQRPVPDQWLPWLEDNDSGGDSIWHTDATSEQATLLGKRTPELQGTSAEQLLHYHWPIIVGHGRLSCEFFYRRGQIIANPALGRRVFLLKPDGVCQHWVTNGIWDHSDVDPANLAASHTPVPLLDDAWNTAELQINGDTLVLSVNGQQVFEGSVHSTNDRRFGMFYFSDQTQAMFRNVVLSGDWPEALPEPTDQELRLGTVDVIDQERRELSASFEFDFATAKDAEISAKFLKYDGYADRAATFTKKPNGLMVRLSGPGNTPAGLGYCAPRILVSGDYDIIAEFEELQTEISGNGSSAIYLANNFSQARMFQLYRGVVRHPGVSLRQLAQSEIYGERNGKWGFRWPTIIREACTSGRLRMIRRGTTVSFLIAEYDSGCFRNLHSEEVSDEDLAVGSLRLRSSCYSADEDPSSVSVTWTRLSVKADGILESFLPTVESGAPTEE